MGVVVSKCELSSKNQRARELRAKIAALEEEMAEARRAREREAAACEQRAAALARREEEWRRERRRHREEAARLRARLRGEEERARRLEAEAAAAAGHGGDKEWRELSASFLVEQMKEEQARREETVEKWKQLYLAIKAELDDLIQRTHQEERFCWGAEQGIIEGLQRELKAKEEAAEALRMKIAGMEKEAARRDREIDILKQSLRILSLNRRSSRVRKSLPKGLHA